VTPKQAKNAIMQLYIDGVAGAFPIALPNQPFAPPAPGAGVVWASIDVRLATGGQDSLGAVGQRKFTRGGVVVVQVSTANGHATSLNDDTAQAALGLLDGVRVAADLWTDGGRVVTVGPDGEWYVQNAVVNVQFEETR
jgi:hypothetical protein